MATQSPFLRLPGEIRNEIYAIYIENYKPDTIELIGSQVRAPPLARVCHEIHDEFCSLWAGTPIDTSMVITLKATVVDLHFLNVHQYLESHEGDFAQSLKDIQIRLVMTRAGVAMSPNAVKQVFWHLRHWHIRAGPLQYGRSGGQEWVTDVSTTYTASFYPKHLKFEGTRFANRLLLTDDKILQPMQVAVERALALRGGGCISSAAKQSCS